MSVDWNKAAYNAGRIVGKGVQKLNDGIDATTRFIHEQTDKLDNNTISSSYLQGYDSSPVMYDTTDTPEHRDAIIEQAKDDLAMIDREYGAGRVVIIDYQDGSRSYHTVHEHQRSVDAVTVMAAFLTNRLKHGNNKIDVLDVVDPYARTVHVIMSVQPRTGDEDSDNPSRIPAVPVNVLATVSIAHVTLRDTSALKVPYDPEDRQWPWSITDTSKYTHAATEYRVVTGNHDIAH